MNPTIHNTLKQVDHVINILCTICVKQTNTTSSTREPWRHNMSAGNTDGQGELVARYRLPRHSFMELCNIVQRNIQRVTHRSHPLTVATQYWRRCAFICHGLYAEGCRRLAWHQPAICLMIDHWRLSSNCMLGQGPGIIFRSNNQTSPKLLFFFGEVANIPNVVGCVNGTQIPVLAPHHNEHLYICRKRFHAMNVQVVCDSQLRFTNIAAKWPGSTHDSFMGQNSALYHRMRIMWSSKITL